MRKVLSTDYIHTRQGGKTAYLYRANNKYREIYRSLTKLDNLSDVIRINKRHKYNMTSELVFCETKNDIKRYIKAHKKRGQHVSYHRIKRYKEYIKEHHIVKNCIR